MKIFIDLQVNSGLDGYISRNIVTNLKHHQTNNNCSKSHENQSINDVSRNSDTKILAPSLPPPPPPPPPPTNQNFRTNNHLKSNLGQYWMKKQLWYRKLHLEHCWIIYSFYKAEFSNLKFGEKFFVLFVFIKLTSLLQAERFISLAYSFIKVEVTVFKLKWNCICEMYMQNFYVATIEF